MMNTKWNEETMGASKLLLMLMKMIAFAMPQASDPLFHSFFCIDPYFVFTGCIHCRRVRKYHFLFVSCILFTYLLAKTNVQKSGRTPIFFIKVMKPQ